MFDIVRDQLQTAAQQAELAGTGIRAKQFMDDVKMFIPRGGETPAVLTAELNLLGSQMKYLQDQALFYDRPLSMIRDDVAHGREPKQPLLDLNAHMSSQAPAPPSGNTVHDAQGKPVGTWIE